MHKRKIWLSSGLLIAALAMSLGHTNTIKAASDQKTITIVDKKSGTTVEIDSSDKLFYNSNQMKRGFYEDKDNDNRQIYQWDITPPTISIDSKDVGSGTKESPYLVLDKSQVITGKVTDDGSGVASLTLNGKVSVPVKNDGTFSVNVNLVEGTTTEFSLTATDNAGNTTPSNSIFMKADTTTPTINITSLTGDTYESAYKFEANVSDNIELLKAKVTLTDNNGKTDEKWINLSDKLQKISVDYQFDNCTKNVIEISVYDVSGNVTTKSIIINKLNNVPTKPALTVSKKDFAWNNSPITTRVTISGSTDKEDGTLSADNYSLVCSQASSIKEVSRTNTSITYDVTFSKRAIGILVVTAADKDGGKAVSTDQITIGAGSTSQGSGQFKDGAFDSGYTDLVGGCYIKTASFNVKITSGHYNNATGDSIVIYGVTESGVEKEIKGYRANFGNTQQSITVDVSGQKFRQVGFRTTSTHKSCAVGATISYNMTYEYSPELDDSTFVAKTTYGGYKGPNFQGQ